MLFSIFNYVLLNLSFVLQAFKWLLDNKKEKYALKKLLISRFPILKFFIGFMFLYANI